MNTNFKIFSTGAPITPWTLPTPPVPDESPPAAPADQAVLSGNTAAAEPSAAPTRGKGRMIALAGLGLVALGVGASLIPGPTGPAHTGISISTTVSRDGGQKTDAQAPTAAPLTIADTQEVSVPLGLEEVDVGWTPTARPFGPSASSVRIQDQTRRTTRTTEDGRQVGLSFAQSTLDLGGGKTYKADGMGWATEQFANEAQQDWQVVSTMEPAGSAGRFASVKLVEGGFTGQSDARETTYRTIDTKTGEAVTLDQILSRADFDKVVQDVQNILERNPDGGKYFQDADILREQVGSSFAIYEEGGRTVLCVAVPAANVADAGTVARVTFRLPSNAVQ